MCKDCGCESGNERIFNRMNHGGGHDHHHPHDHDHHHSHDHNHDHPHHHDHDHEGGRRTIDLETRVLEENDFEAKLNREWLQSRDIMTLNFISSPGSGKTFLLEKTLEGLRNQLGMAVITGDQQTDRDAQRLQGKGAPVAQIETYSSCHLDAKRVKPYLEELLTDETDLLFIENVGNLVCPAAFDLGEHFKVALLSVTEGEDKPLKYPVLFSDSPVVIITKTDLVPHLDWDMAQCRKNIRKVRPDVKIFELSARTGDGMDAWFDYLKDLVR